MSNSLCKLCPRNCKIDRNITAGFCGASSRSTVAKAMLHQWEEPCICYGNGSGAVFFSGCQLKCVFCQNHSISRKVCGKEFGEQDLASLFLKLQELGACNINLVSPTPHLNTLIPALSLAKSSGLSIPVLYNTGGYESLESLKRLEGLIDIYLPDFKFYSSEISLRYAKVSDYAKHAITSLFEMHRQVKNPNFHEDHLTSGVIVRHLVLPGCSKDSIAILNLLSQSFRPDEIILSIMQQYTPMVDSAKFPELSRTVTTLEYNRVINEATKLGFTNIYGQSRQSVGENFVPNFSVFFDETN